MYAHLCVCQCKRCLHLLQHCVIQGVSYIVTTILINPWIKNQENSRFNKHTTIIISHFKNRFRWTLSLFQRLPQITLNNMLFYEIYSISNYGISHVYARNGFVICPVILRYIIKFGLIFRQLTVSKTFSICTYLFPVLIIASLYVYYFAINHANTILGKPYL